MAWMAQQMSRVWFGLAAVLLSGWLGRLRGRDGCGAA